MEREALLINQIKAEGMLPLYYHDDVTVCEGVLRALYNGGVRSVEFTNRGPQALSNFKHLVALKSSMPGLILGIGTIKTPQDASAFIEAGAFQCGFCTPGFILMVGQLLDKNPNPSEAEIRHYLSGNLCRCGAYPEIIKAVFLAIEKRKIVN